MNLNDNIQFLSLRLQTNPDSFLFARLADYLLRNGELDKAVEVCENGLKRHPYYVTAHFIMGKCYLQKKMYDQAEKEFKRVLFFDPKFLAAHKYYAEIMQHIGWDNAVENSYRSIIQIDPFDQETRAKLAQLMAEKKEPLEDEDTLPFPESEADDALEDLEETESSEFDESEENPAMKIEPGEATHSSEETLTDEEAVNSGEQIFEAVIEEEPPSAEEEEKFSYILDDIFREESAIEDGTSSFQTDQENFEDSQAEQVEEDIFGTKKTTPAPPDSQELPEDFFGKSEIEQPETDSETEDDFLTIDSGYDAQENDAEPAPPPRHKITPTPTPRPSIETSEITDLKELARDVQINGKPGGPARAKKIQDDFDEIPVTNEDFVTSGNLKRKKEKIVTPTLGEIYAAQGQYAKAIGVFEILRKKEPTNPIFIEKIKYLKRKLEEANNDAQNSG